jgi:hypothetical protein
VEEGGATNLGILYDASICEEYSIELHIPDTTPGEKARMGTDGSFRVVKRKGRVRLSEREVGFVAGTNRSNVLP